MKRTILLFLLSLTTIVVAQESKETENIVKNNELKLNAGYLLAGGFFETSYERILNEESAIGLSLGYAFDKSIDYEFSVVPYYRLYFGKKRAAGFFMEANGAFYSEESEDNNDMNEIGLGVGFSIGGKFITKSGWIFELLGGGGRNFINKDKITEAYARIGLIIGKRF